MEPINRFIDDNKNYITDTLNKKIKEKGLLSKEANHEYDLILVNNL